jgi:hypothetical protein
MGSSTTEQILDAIYQLRIDIVEIKGSLVDQGAEITNIKELMLMHNSVRIIEPSPKPKPKPKCGYRYQDEFRGYQDEFRVCNVEAKYIISSENHSDERCGLHSQYDFLTRLFDKYPEGITIRRL